MNANDAQLSFAGDVPGGKTDTELQPGASEVESGRSARRWWKSDWFLALLLLVTTLMTYQPAWHGEAVYDDDDHLTPPELQSLSGLVRIWTQLGVVSQYYP